MNTTILLGRFTRDNDVRYSQSGMAILTNTIAVNRMKQDEADFISVKAFDKNAENINKYFNKGNLICIQGHIQTGKYENSEGRMIYTTDVIIDRWDFTGEKKADNNQATTRNEFEELKDIEDIDLPF